MSCYQSNLFHPEHDIPPKSSLLHHNSNLQTKEEKIRHSSFMLSNVTVATHAEPKLGKSSKVLEIYSDIVIDLVRSHVYIILANVPALSCRCS